jgi:hypothetical protein
VLTAANDDISTIGLDATAGHPQLTPKLVCAKLGAIAVIAMMADETIFEIVLFVFILFFFGL